MPTKWVIRILVFAAIGLLIATVFRLLTPHSPTIPASEVITTNTDGSRTVFSNVSYTGSELNVPPQLDIGAYEANEIPLVSRLTQDYQLQSASTTFKVWRGPEYTLTYSSQIDQYTLSLNQLTETDETKTINPEFAQALATDFVQKYLPEAGVELITDQIVFSIDEDDTAVDPTKAHMAFFPFSYALSGYPVVMGASNLLPVGITVDQNNQLTKVVFTPALLRISPVGKKSTLSLSQAVKNINNGQASITSAFQTEFKEIKLASITEGTLSSATLQYRLDPEHKLVYPFYIFKGTVKNDQNVELEVQISTPAVAIN